MTTHFSSFASFNTSENRFIAVWFTKATDLWSQSEDLWEGDRLLNLKLLLNHPKYCTTSGIFELIACIMIFVMGITMLKMDRGETSKTTCYELEIIK